MPGPAVIRLENERVSEPLSVNDPVLVMPRQTKHYTYPLIVLILYISTCLPGATAWAQDGRNLPVVSIDTLSHLLLRAPAEVLITDTHATLNSVKSGPFQPLTGAHVNQGISDLAFWMRVRLSNETNPHDRAWVLHHETSYLDNLTIYHADNGEAFNRVALSDRRPFHERPVNYRKLAFAHRTPAGGYTDLYLRIGYEKTDAVSLNLHIWDEILFQESVRHESVLQGIYFGMMLILILIALVCAILLRQIVHLHYALFLAFSSLTWAALSGFSFEYLWPNSVYLHNEGFHLLFLMLSISALQFSKSFLVTQQTLPTMHRLISALQIVMVAGILFRLAGFYESVLWLSYASVSMLILLPVLGLLAYSRGLRYARWYVIAWLVYSGGLIVSVLSAATGVFQWGMSPLAFAQMGSLLEAMMLLMALGERLVDWDRDRKRALAMAHQDALTGLGNRRAMTHALDMFRDRFARDGLPVFAIMIDLDHFKRINDRYGHDAGDQVLVEMARLLQNQTRPDDVCIRYGGEEFAVLLQTPSPATALHLAERIRQQFQDTPTLYRGAHIQHTLSAGLTEVLSRNQQALSANEMIIQADTALYQAKRTGRNRTTLFQRGETSAGQEDPCGEQPLTDSNQTA